MLQTLNGILRQTNLGNESEEYLSKREELRLAEIELMNQREPFFSSLRPYCSLMNTL